MIYKILPDYENYCAFDLPMRKLLLSMGNKVPPQKLMHFYRHNLKLNAHWGDIHASFTPVEGVTKYEAIPDITTWVPGTIILSDEAKKSLSITNELGEFLPVNTPHGVYWILNISSEVDADESISQRTLEAGQVLSVEKLIFSNETPAQPLFKTNYDGFRNVFCNSETKKFIEKLNLAGIVFSSELSGAFS